MPIPIQLTEGETATIALPVSLGAAAYGLGGVSAVELVIAGFDGRLTGLHLTDGTRVYVLDDQAGYLGYDPAAGELLAAASPYRVYARLYNDVGRYFVAPKGDYWLLEVYPSLL